MGFRRCIMPEANIDPAESPGQAAPGECDTVTFSGIGTWSLDPDNGVHIAVVQICTSPEFPYLSIIIDPGWYSTSNVNTKPKDMAITMP